jgi:hypothetical protein
MKKTLTFMFILLSVLCLTGCGNKNSSSNNEQNAITADSFAFKKNLKCDDLNKYDILEVTNDYFILSNNIAYLYTDGYYSNDQQCIPMSEEHKFRDKNLIDFNNQIYEYHPTTGLVEAHYYTYPTAILNNSISRINKWGLNDEQRKKYGEPREKSSGGKGIIDEYEKYVYIKNGSIYEGFVKHKYYRYYEADREESVSSSLVDEKVLFSSEEYGNITDYYCLEFQAVWKSMIISDKGVYILSDDETEECKKYEDIECEKKFLRREDIDKYMGDIKYINAYYFVTKNNSIGALSDLLEEIERN